jgi:hypothetical protein
MKIKNALAFLILFGLVDQINGNIAMIEYESKGRILYSEVDLNLSACQPKEGDRVSFLKDYKIVTCGEKQ